MKPTDSTSPVRLGHGRLATRLAVFVLLLVSALAAYAQSAPSGIWAVANSSTANYVYWNEVPGATGYKVYAGTSSNGQNATPVGTVTSESFYHSGLTAGVRIYYKVTAMYGTSESARSVEGSAKPGADRTGWPFVTTHPGANQVVVRWSEVPGATKYHVYRYDGWPTSWRQIGTTAGFSFTDSTAVNGTFYTYMVRGFNVDTEMQDSYQITAVPGDTPPPPPVAAWAYPYGTSTSLYWEKVPGAVRYMIYRSTASNGQTLKPHGQATGTSFGDNNLIGGTTYYYKICAVDDTGAGVRGSEVSVTPGSTVLAAPYLSAGAGADRITLNWTESPGATFYILFRRRGSEPWEFYSQQTGRSYTDLAVNDGYTYSYYVYPGSPNGIGYYSATVSAKAGSLQLAGPYGIYVRAASNGNTVYWNPVVGADSYNVYRGSTSTNVKLFKNTGGTSLWDPDIVAGTRYFYKVRAVYSGTEGKYSAAASGKPGSTVLGTPQLAAYPVAGKINLYWDLVPNAASYTLFRNADNEGWLVLRVGVKPAVDATYGSYIDGTAKPGVDYRYMVAGVNADGTGDNNNQVNVTAGNPPLPAPFGGWVFNYSSSLGVYVEPVAGATSYNLYRTTTPGVYSSMPYKVNLGSSFSDSNVSPGTTYYYKWAPVDQNGQGPLSPEISGNPGGTSPAAPIVTSHTLAASIRLYWEAVPGATKYNVFRAVGSSGDYKLHAYNVADPRYFDTAVTPGVRYYYYVYPVNTDGSGGRSNTVSGRPGSSAPQVPVGLYGIPGSGYASLDWEPVLGASTYNVYRSTTAGGQGMAALAVGVGNGHTDYNVTNLVTYYYKVTAVSANGQSLRSQEISVQPGTTRMTAVTLYNPTATPGNIALSWSAHGSATGYHVWRLLHGDPVWRLVANNNPTTSFNDTTAIPGAEYTYRVAPVNANGTGNFSSQKTVVAQ